MNLRNIAVTSAALSVAGAASAAGTHGASTSMSSPQAYSSSQQGQDQNVREVQQMLSQQGFDPGPADGIMGPHTQKALRAFQQAHNLQASGSIDDQTLSALGVQGGTAGQGGMSSSGSPETAGSSGNSATMNSTDDNGTSNSSDNGSNYGSTGNAAGTSSSPRMNPDTERVPTTSPSTSATPDDRLPASSPSAVTGNNTGATPDASGMNGNRNATPSGTAKDNNAYGAPSGSSGTRQ